MTVDAVVVSYNSRRHLRTCVEALLVAGAAVQVVDNASVDGSLETIGDLPAACIRLDRNHGFAHGCNVGWREGTAPYVLLVNPDAVVGGAALAALAGVLDRDPATAIAAPRIVHADGGLDFSQRRFPQPWSTFAQALFLHRLWPEASWTDEVIRRPEAYDRPGSPDWVSGACLLVRRSVLERLGGLDDGFFMYGEDIDLCRRVRDLGLGVRYEPRATVVHVGGASAPRSSLLPVLARSRIRYATKHRCAGVALVERVGVALGALTHIAVARGGRDVRRGHARALRAAATPVARPYRPARGRRSIHPNDRRRRRCALLR